ncbi:SAM-dependent methyltransferase [Mycobacterium sp. 050134]|uniref:SAM-dependent methyltransferase n=1 Tax=Mycobacterium sp. 050134 TaxID=3096111 RepID=UPI002EDA8E98
MDLDELPTGVGWTGLMTAYSRAQESFRADRRFTDPLATAVVAAAVGTGNVGDTRLPRLGPAKDDGSSTLWNMLSFYFAQRTLFYDSRLQGAIDAGCRQVVLLGAGFDGRALRMGLPEDTTVFEIDQAPVLDFKQRVLLRHKLIAACSRVALCADLREEIAGPLLAAGFRPERQTVWIAEGLLMYFTPAQADHLLSRVDALSAPGSRVISEYFTRPWGNPDVSYEMLDDQDRAVWDLLMQEFLNGPLPQEPGAWLSAHGWTVGAQTTVGELSRASGREVPPEFATPGNADIWLFDGAKGVRAI